MWCLRLRLRLRGLLTRFTGTRANLNYLDQLAKFHKQQGTNLNRFPSVDKRPLDLYRLKKAVEVRGGFDKVCKHKKWAEIGRDLGYSGKIMSSLSTSLKNSYQRWLNPYEEYLRLAKPGVQMKLEHEYGGPLTPSPAESPLKRSQADSPGGSQDPAPVARTSAHSHVSSRGRGKDSNQSEEPKVPPLDTRRPTHPSGFTPVNGPGFTAVNASRGVRRKSDRDRTPTRRFADSPTGSSKDTPEHPSHGSSGMSYRMKRKASHEGLDRSAQPESATEMNDSPENGGRRSKRLKKGTFRRTSARRAACPQSQSFFLMHPSWFHLRWPWSILDFRVFGRCQWQLVAD